MTSSFNDGNKPKYIIVAGVNGAGKSSLYHAEPELFIGTTRINADEILQKFGGDWRNVRDNYKAMKMEIRELHASLKNGISIHVETTLAGSAKTHRNLIDEAHRNGYEVTLIYVVLDSYKRAINRVDQRVKKGGHGIDHDLIKKRYYKSLDNLTSVAASSDNVYIYDNTELVQSIYVREHNNVRQNHLSNYPMLKL